jgi:hypothetical protein
MVRAAMAGFGQREWKNGGAGGLELSAVSGQLSAKAVMQGPLARLDIMKMAG